MAKNEKSYTKDNQPKNRPPRGKAKKTLMLDAIRAVCGTEEEFLERVVTAGMGDPENDVAPNLPLLSLVINRIEPPLKAVSPTVEFKFRKSARPHEQAEDVLIAVSDGLISPDIGQMFISSISSMLKIQEITELEDRITAIEKMREQE